jgi:hypothetical protein
MFPDSPYRTTLRQVADGNIWKTVREVLPGQAIDPKDPFLDEFITFVHMNGYLSFDTERPAHPVMVQVRYLKNKMKFNILC